MNKKDIFSSILPFINLNFSTVAENPLETNVKYVIPMTIKRLSKNLGYWSLKHFREDLTSCKVNGLQVFQTIELGRQRSKDHIIVNPRVLFPGQYKPELGTIAILFNEKGTII